MISESFIKSTEYLTLKEYLNDEIVNRPLKIKTDDRTNEAIAREVEAFGLAAKMVKKAISNFERLTVSSKTNTTESWK